MQPLPNLNLSHLTVEAGPVDLEVEQSFTQFISPLDRRADLYAQLEMERKILEGILFERENHRLDGALFEAQRLAGLAAVATTIRALRRYTGIQRVAPLAEIIRDGFKKKEHEKVVIYAIHRDVIRGLFDRFRRYRLKPIMLYGGMQFDKQKRAVQRFQETSRYNIFIANIVSCGPRVHLTRAHDAYFIEQEWKPEINAMALMRLHNLDQKNAVHARFVSIDEKQDRLISRIMMEKTEEFMRPTGLSAGAQRVS